MGVSLCNFVLVYLSFGQDLNLKGRILNLNSNYYRSLELIGMSGAKTMYTSLGNYCQIYVCQPLNFCYSVWGQRGEGKIESERAI